MTELELVNISFVWVPKRRIFDAKPTLNSAEVSFRDHVLQDQKFKLENMCSSIESPNLRSIGSGLDQLWLLDMKVPIFGAPSEDAATWLPLSTSEEQPERRLEPLSP